MSMRLWTLRVKQHPLYSGVGPGPVPRRFLELASMTVDCLRRFFVVDAVPIRPVSHNRAWKQISITYENLK